METTGGESHDDRRLKRLLPIFVCMIAETKKNAYISENMTRSFNPDKQHTLQSEVGISGTGIHTGVFVDMILKPAAPNFGIQFQRIDLPGEPVIKADCDLVTDTSRGTTLESNGMKINTVEHVLAAVVGMGVDNILISLNGPEVPIMDGSSEPFVEIIEKAGVEEQDAEIGRASCREREMSRECSR